MEKNTLVSFYFLSFLVKVSVACDQTIPICRDTSFSPHLSRDRKWAQQAQYNRFVREWVKELG